MTVNLDNAALEADFLQKIKARDSDGVDAILLNHSLPYTTICSGLKEAISYSDYDCFSAICRHYSLENLIAFDVITSQSNGITPLKALELISTHGPNHKHQKILLDISQTFKLDPKDPHLFHNITRHARSQCNMKGMVALRKNNPPQALGAPSFNEMIHYAHDQRYSSDDFFSLVASKWANGAAFSKDRLVAHGKNLLTQKDISLAHSDDALIQWLTQPLNYNVTRLVGMDLLKPAFDLTAQEEAKLWRMKNGRFITPKEMDTLLASNDRASVVNVLLEASGLSNDRLNDTCGAIKSLKDLKSGRPIKKLANAKRLVETLYPPAVDNPAYKNQSAALFSLFTDTPIMPTLEDLVLQAMDMPGDAKVNFIKMIVGGRIGENGPMITGINSRTNEQLSEPLCITPGNVNHFRSGRREFIREFQADVIIDLALDAGVEVTDESRELAVAFLTDSPKPSVMLKDMVEGKFDNRLGRRDPNNCLPLLEMLSRWKERVGANETDLFPDVSVSVFRTLKKGGHLETGSAEHIADYFGFTDKARSDFITIATGHKVVDLNALIDQTLEGNVSRSHALNTLLEQTGKSRAAFFTTLGISPNTAGEWLRKGYMPQERALEAFADALHLEHRLEDLKYIFHARSPDEKTDYIQYIDKERHGWVARIAACAMAAGIENEGIKP